LTAELWLSLKLLGRASGTRIAKKARPMISIPKKVAPLAVTRNRVKRLIREAVRLTGDPAPKKKYCFRVHRIPEKLNLEIVQKAVADVRQP
jgi:ribonuclease P protein component